MCLIVDNSVRDRVFLKPDDGDFSELHSCLFGPGRPAVRIVYGGKLRLEYLQSGKILEQLRTLDQKGQARTVDDHLVEQEIAVVIAKGLCRSNDEHVIALARVARVGLLCADDAALKQDFKTRELINNPRGKVYNRRSHGDLLRVFCSRLGNTSSRRRRR